jgi:hypothetical protein
MFEGEEVARRDADIADAAAAAVVVAVEEAAPEAVEILRTDVDVAGAGRW